RNPCGENAFLCVYGELVALRRPYVQQQSVILTRNLLYPNTLCETAAVLVEFDDQAVQQRHGIELGLVGKPDAAVERERGIRVVNPLPRQLGCLEGVKFSRRDR